MLRNPFNHNRYSVCSLFFFFIVDNFEVFHSFILFIAHWLAAMAFILNEWCCVCSMLSRSLPMFICTYRKCCTEIQSNLYLICVHILWSTIGIRLNIYRWFIAILFNVLSNGKKHHQMVRHGNIIYFVNRIHMPNTEPISILGWFFFFHRSSSLLHLKTKHASIGSCLMFEWRRLYRAEPNTVTVVQMRAAFVFIWRRYE